jgi:hypothetical protein
MQKGSPAGNSAIIRAIDFITESIVVLLVCLTFVFYLGREKRLSARLIKTSLLAFLWVGGYLLLRISNISSAVSLTSLSYILMHALALFVIAIIDLAYSSGCSYRNVTCR